MAPGGLNCIKYVYIYYIYSPRLGGARSVFSLEREQGRFKREHEGARGSREGAEGVKAAEYGLTRGPACYGSSARLQLPSGL